MTTYELIEQSIRESFSYRTSLNIPKNKHFGIEAEIEGIDVLGAKRMLQGMLNRDWQLKYEGSLEPNSLELASPVLQNQKEIWKLLWNLGKTLQRLKPTFEHASFQVNLDNHLADEQLVWLLKFFATYEDIIYRFSKGTDACFRQTIFDYAHPITSFLKTITHEGTLTYKNDCAIKNEFQDFKHFAINFKTNTIHSYEGALDVGRSLENIFGAPILLIEFRTPDGTVNPILWQNYINTFYHLLNFVQSPLFDFEKVEYEWKMTQVANLATYEKMNVNKALTFANLIFEKDIDKIYFLKQYIGNDIEESKQYKKVS